MDRISIRRMLSVCAVLLLVVVPLISCAPKAPEVVEVVDPVEKLVFTRTGAGLFLEETLDVANITVVDKTGKEVASQEVNAKISQALLDFEWVPLEKYQFKIDAAEGKFATTGCAPAKPSPLLLGTYDLGEARPGWTVFPLGGCPHGNKNVGATVHISLNDKYVTVNSSTHLRLFEIETQKVLLTKEFGDKERISGVMFSDDSKYLLVTTNAVKPPEYWRATVYVFDVETQEEVWSKQWENTSSASVFISGDSKYLLVGVKEVKSHVLCLELATGAEKWSFAVTDDVGEGVPEKYRDWPSVSVDMIDSNNYALVSASRLTKEEHWEEAGLPKTHEYYACKTYSFDVATGNLLWTFPKEGTIDSGWGYGTEPAQVTPDGKYVICSISSGIDFTCKEGYVVCLDGANGEELWRYSLPRQHDNEITECCEPNISPDGKHVMVYTTSTLYDEKDIVYELSADHLVLDNSKMIETRGTAEPLWNAPVDQNYDIDGVLVRTKSTRNYFVKTIGGQESILYLTYFGMSSPTTIEGLRLMPLAEHPYMHTLFLYDIDGTLLSRWRFEGSPHHLHFSQRKYGVDELAGGKYVALRISQTLLPDHLVNLIPKSTQNHGLYMFNLDREGNLVEKLDWFYHTEGACWGIGITSDGKYLVAVEAPVDMNPDPEVEEVVGSYKVHFLN